MTQQDGTFSGYYACLHPPHLFLRSQEPDTCDLCEERGDRARFQPLNERMQPLFPGQYISGEGKTKL